MPGTSAPIKCEIFQSEERVVRELTLQINKIRHAQIRKIRAQDLLAKTQRLLGCWLYDSAKPDCHNCQLISKLRKKTALFVIGVAEMDEERGREGRR